MNFHVGIFPVHIHLWPYLNSLLEHLNESRLKLREFNFKGHLRSKKKLSSNERA